MPNSVEEAAQQVVHPKAGTGAAGLRRVVRGLLDGVREQALLILQGVVAVVAAVATARPIATAMARMRYPFELEFMEGAVVDHIRVVLAGEPLYRTPSVAFTPFIYTPLYYQVSALLSRALGVGLLAPRLVSTVATLGTMALIASFVRRETGSTLAALVAVALCASTYQLTGFWMDIARVDSLFVLLLLASAWLARYGKSWGAAVACGITLFLAFFTKQSALMFALPVLAGFALLHLRRALLATAVFVAITAGTIAWMNHTTDGWFHYYVFEVPGRHPMLWDRWRPLLVDLFWTPLVVPVLLAWAGFWRQAATAEHRRTALFFGALWLVALLSSYSSLLHRDGFVNVLMPYCAFTAVVAGIGMAAASRAPRGHAHGNRALQAFVLLAVLTHLGATSYDQQLPVPTRKDVEAGRTIIDGLRQRQGTLLMLGTGWYGAMAGHEEMHAHAMALADIYKTGDKQRIEPLQQELLSAIRSQRFATIVMDRSFSLLPPEISAEIRRLYRPDGRILQADQDAAWPKTGFQSRPDELWVPLVGR